MYVLKPNNTASLGLVRELEHKEKGSETPWLVLQKWHDLDPKTGLRAPYTLRENRDKCRGNGARHLRAAQANLGEN